MNAARPSHRAPLWKLGAPIRALLVGAIRVYQVTFSGLFGGRCKYYPSCSRYAVEAIRSHGALKGSALATWRLLRCNPLSLGGVDHVPPSRTGGKPYDIIVHRRRRRSHTESPPASDRVEA